MMFSSFIFEFDDNLLPQFWTQIGSDRTSVNAITVTPNNEFFITGKVYPANNTLAQVGTISPTCYLDPTGLQSGHDAFIVKYDNSPSRQIIWSTYYQ